MKKFAMVTAILVTLAGCSASTIAEAKTVETVSTANGVSPLGQGLWNPSGERSLTVLIRKQRIVAQLNQNTARVTTAAEKLNKYVGKTWYVFAGSTPSGWDCSGLVLWYYKQLGIKLPHSATAQKNEGKPRKYSDAKAKVGDIIWFPGHVGVYVGDGYMIHSPHPGARTQRIKVTKWAKANSTSNVTYTRLITTN